MSVFSDDNLVNFFVVNKTKNYDEVLQFNNMQKNNENLISVDLYSVGIYKE